MKTYNSEQKMLDEIDRCLDLSNQSLKAYESNIELSKTALMSGDKTVGNHYREEAQKQKARSDRYLMKSKRIGIALAKFRTQILPGVEIPQ